MSTDIFAAHVKWITLYNEFNDKFWAFPKFIITPSLVVKLSTTTANNGMDAKNRFGSELWNGLWLLTLDDTQRIMPYLRCSVYTT